MNSNNSSGYKGVYKKNGSTKWASQLRSNNSSRHIGYFDSKEDAAQAVILVAYIEHGEFARME